MLYHLMEDAEKREAAKRAKQESPPPSRGHSGTTDHSDGDLSDHMDIVEVQERRHSWAPPPNKDLLENLSPPKSPQITQSHVNPDSLNSPLRNRLLGMLKKSFRTSLEGKTVQDAFEKANPDKNLRTIDGAFNVSNTTTKDTPTIKLEVERVLSDMGIKFKLNKKGIAYDCKLKNSAQSIRFTVEICKIKKLPGLRGLKFNRTKGTVFEFKDVYSRICSQLVL